MQSIRVVSLILFWATLDAQSPDSRAALARAPDGTPVVDAELPASIALMELLYDQGVERFDRVLDELLEGLRRIDPERTWAVVVTSDHGEALYDRGWGEHGHALFEDEVGIPLAMWLPGVEPMGTVPCAVGLVDLLPTLCDYLGVDCPADHDGRSMFREEIADPTRGLRIEGAIARPEVRAVRDARWKLMAEPLGAVTAPLDGVSPALGPFALFDLETDPGEQLDLVPTLDARPAARRAFSRLRTELDRRPAGVPAGPSAPRVQLDAASRTRLEALGYIDPSPRPDAGDGASEPSPGSVDHRTSTSGPD